MGRRSFHSPLTRMLREAQAAAGESAATGIGVDEITGMRAERGERSRAVTGRCSTPITPRPGGRPSGARLTISAAGTRRWYGCGRPHPG